MHKKLTGVIVDFETEVKKGKLKGYEWKDNTLKRASNFNFRCILICIRLSFHSNKYNAYICQLLQANTNYL